MIDMHIHVVDPQLPGVKEFPVDFNSPAWSMARLVHEEMNRSGTSVALAMGHLNGTGNDPLGVYSTLEIAARGASLYAIGIADPNRTSTDHLQGVEKQIRSGKVKALKAYLGYVHAAPGDAGYRPYYELAEKYKIPFIFHTGDNWSRQARVKYAHPLQIDDVAVEHPRVNFVLAHFGNPWIMDAAEVMYKNDNVWADLCAILVGDHDYFRRIHEEGIFDRMALRVQDGIDFVDRPDRFLYGTDWPLTPMSLYPEFVKRLFLEKHHQAVFEDNARNLFNL